MTTYRSQVKLGVGWLWEERMRFICYFSYGGSSYGLYQCDDCKTISFNSWSGYGATPPAPVCNCKKPKCPSCGQYAAPGTVIYLDKVK